jgi:short-subunit dehydrogenase
MGAVRPSQPRYALITGASTGIGRALAVQLAQEGFDLHLMARNAEALAEATREARVFGGHAEYTVLDIAQTSEAVAEIRRIDTKRPIDLVIANAGVGALPAFSPYSWEAMEPAFHTNFCGAAATLTALTSAMVQRGHGHLVGIGSLASRGALPMSAAYCAPKAGLSMLLECLSLDLLGSGVAVTDVRLGFVQTRMLAHSTHPLPQLMTPEQAALRIVRGLRNQPRTLTIPASLGIAASLAGHIPRALREAIVRHLPRLRERS